MNEWWGTKAGREIGMMTKQLEKLRNSLKEMSERGTTAVTALIKARGRE